MAVIIGGGSHMRYRLEVDEVAAVPMAARYVYLSRRRCRDARTPTAEQARERGIAEGCEGNFGGEWVLARSQGRALRRRPRTLEHAAHLRQWCGLTTSCQVCRSETPLGQERCDWCVSQGYGRPVVR